MYPFLTGEIRRFKHDTRNNLIRVKLHTFSVLLFPMQIIFVLVSLHCTAHTHGNNQKNR